jgi:hypothetical protein
LIHPPHFIDAASQRFGDTQEPSLTHSPRLQTFTSNAVAKFGFPLYHQHTRTALRHALR